MSAPTSPEPDGLFQVQGRITLFGFTPVEALAGVRPRSRSWRIGGAVRTGAIALVIAPVVGIIPPHVPWILGALGVGTLGSYSRNWLKCYLFQKEKGKYLEKVDN